MVDPPGAHNLNFALALEAASWVFTPYTYEYTVVGQFFVPACHEIKITALAFPPKSNFELLLLQRDTPL
jgi:hypothetical protein